MIPLTLADTGEENIIKKVEETSDTRKFLENLGFVAGGTVTIINPKGGNVIVTSRIQGLPFQRKWLTKL
ncbi:MAG: ferrous iron transport protein A [Oscillospiraceae bacterium]